GVNASVMPGVKIGANSFVGAGVVLDGDLPADSFCVTKKAYWVSKNKYHATTNIRAEFKKQL
ncbi:MAG: sugar O-acetyltransferase, partial [Patescibacteria group bacterium]